MKRHGLLYALVRGLLAGGLTAGLAGGLVVGGSVYQSRLDPQHPVLTPLYFFGVGFALSAIVGMVVGTLVSLALYCLPHRNQPVTISADVPPEHSWPPAPKIDVGKEDDLHP